MPSGWPVHVLLTKADKLNQRDRAAALKEAEELLGEGSDGPGVLGHGQDRRAGRPEATGPDAEPSLDHLTVRRRFGGVSDVGGAQKKKAPVVNHRGQTNPAQVS